MIAALAVATVIVTMTVRRARATGIATMIAGTGTMIVPARVIGMTGIVTVIAVPVAVPHAILSDE